MARAAGDDYTPPKRRPVGNNTGQDPRAGQASPNYKGPVQPAGGELFAPNSNLPGGGVNQSQEVTYKGGFLGLEDKGMREFLVDPAAYASQQGGIQSAIQDRYTHLTGAGSAAPQAQAFTAQNVAANQEMRDRQSTLADMLYRQAMGQGPSAAQAQLQAGNAAAINAQMAMARSSGNPNAMRQAQFNAAGLTQQSANQAAQLRANEMLAGRQLYTQQLEGTRAQDLGQRAQDIQQLQFNAGQKQTVSLANAQLSQEQQKFVEDAVTRYLAMGKDINEANRLARIALTQTQTGMAIGQEATRTGHDQAGGQSATQAGVAAIGALGSLLSARVGK